MSAIALSFATVANAAILRVGAGQQYSTIQAASNKANRGDIIEISPGVYNQGAAFYDHELVIRAAPGSAPGSVIVRNGTVQGKALFVTAGNNTVVDGIRFENGFVAQGNGAGIRAEGGNLTVLNSIFDGGEHGILVGGAADPSHKVIVRDSVFTNIYSPQSPNALTHALYVGKSIGELEVTGSTFTDVATGHYIKSRAERTIVRDNIIDDRDGSGSYLIETPEGGSLIVERNVLINGPNSGNRTTIAHGFETKKGGGFVNPPGIVFIGDNDFTNFRPGSTTVFFENRTGEPAELHENTITVSAGSVDLARGEYRVTTDADDNKPIDFVSAPVRSLPAFDNLDLGPPAIAVDIGPAQAVSAPGVLGLMGAGFGLLAFARRRQ
ncbi:MAG: right-handed parallel beta-helix repeat-containing protein [Pacificimonas sp.]